MSAPEAPTAATVFVAGALLTIEAHGLWPAAVGAVDRVLAVRRLAEGLTVVVERLDAPAPIGPPRQHRVPADTEIEWSVRDGHPTATFALAVNFRKGAPPPAFPACVTYRITPPATAEENRAA